MNYNAIFVFLILIKSCTACADANAEFSNTAPTCTLNCDTINKSCAKRTMTNPGCYCKDGSVQNCAGVCVKILDYCKTCPANEYYTECRLSPQPSCQNPNPKSNNVEQGCACTNGYIRDYDGVCIPQSSCPTCNDTNSEYSVLAPTCDLTCETLNAPCTKPTVRNPACYCKEGYVKNCKEICTHGFEYCGQCNFNEHYSDCGPSPEASCDDPSMNTTKTQQGCFCNAGLIRNYDKKCVAPKDCPSMSCIFIAWIFETKRTFYFFYFRM